MVRAEVLPFRPPEAIQYFRRESFGFRLPRIVIPRRHLAEPERDGVLAAVLDRRCAFFSREIRTAPFFFRLLQHVRGVLTELFGVRPIEHDQKSLLFLRLETGEHQAVKSYRTRVAV